MSEQKSSQMPGLHLFFTLLLIASIASVLTFMASTGFFRVL